jgi:diaminohydroxyphosphoribosylaminopyrimidine deaminase/5-amino-6-(5-phosphoribosylamino)uracil reductase
MNHMGRALKLARRVLGTVSPNPAVGALVVKEGVVVGQGVTEPPGGDHAEVVALNSAGDYAAGAVLYTTLEPCIHFGRTPPCTGAIVRSGIKEVRIATTDPNPIVSGKGIQELRDANIKVAVGEESEQALKIIEAYSKFITTKMPFVTAKFAMSLDGKIATSSGDSKWITSERARWHTHKIRSQSDAILTGINTVIADDPLLTARNERGNPILRQPIRVVIDTHGRIPENSQLLKQPGQTILSVCKIQPEKYEYLKQLGVNTIISESPSGNVDIQKTIQILAVKENVTSILVESGATIMGTLFDLSLVDKVIAFIAPTIIGGGNSPSPVAGEGVQSIVESLKLQRVQWKRFGRDIAITGYC